MAVDDTVRTGLDRLGRAIDAWGEPRGFRRRGRARAWARPADGVTHVLTVATRWGGSWSVEWHVFEPTSGFVLAAGDATTPSAMADRAAVSGSVDHGYLPAAVLASVDLTSAVAASLEALSVVDTALVTLGSVERLRDWIVPDRPGAEIESLRPSPVRWGCFIREALSVAVFARAPDRDAGVGAATVAEIDRAIDGLASGSHDDVAYFRPLVERLLVRAHAVGLSPEPLPAPPTDGAAGLAARRATNATAFTEAALAVGITPSPRSTRILRHDARPDVRWVLGQAKIRFEQRRDDGSGWDLVQAHLLTTGVDDAMRQIHELFEPEQAAEPSSPPDSTSV